jgi:uncharacterized membrane protein (UPF0127 family)
VRKILLAVILISTSTLIFSLLVKGMDKEETNSNQRAKLTIARKELTVEIVDSPRELEAGLSGREGLTQNEGMYFVLGNDQTINFWMKGMKFPIDIIWINNNKVVGIEKNAPIPSGSYIPSFPSPGKVTHVLEVNAGFSNEHGIEVGTKVELNTL